jgi:opacity protein-like surface antigen
MRGAPRLLRIARIALCILVLPGASFLRAQEVQSPKIDVAITFVAEDSLRSATPDNFWMKGGSIELGTNTWRGLGIAANVSGTHTGAIGATTIPLSIVPATFGPRYRWHADHRVSIYCEGLIGEANGFKSLFPAITGAQTSANSFASQVGGGLDYQVSQHIAVRAVEAAWQHTQLPNGTNNVQNDLRLGAGLILRFGR